MRASSLSDDRIIALLKRQFVPVWLSIDDYALPGKEEAERKEWQRIYDASLRRGFSTGSVHVYIVAPSGDPVGTMHVAEAAVSEKLLPLLRRVVETERVSPRSAEGERRFAARARRTARVTGPARPYLQIWTRYVGHEAEAGITRDRLGLSPAEWAALAPPAAAQIGATWQAPRDAIDRLYAYFFPPVGNYEVWDSKIRHASLTATVEAVSGGEARLSLRGELEMGHRREKNNDGEVAARLRGEARYDTVRRRFTAFQLASEEARFVWHYEGAAVPSQFAVAAELVQ